MKYACDECEKTGSDCEAGLWPRECGMFEVILPDVVGSSVFAACSPACAIRITARHEFPGWQKMPLSKTVKCERCGKRLPRHIFDDEDRGTVPDSAPRLVHPGCWDYHCFCSGECMIGYLRALGNEVATAE